MSILKYIQRLQHIDRLIRRRATGRPEEFAEKVGLCRSTLLDYLRELRELGAPIGYCKRQESYFYQANKQLFIGYTDQLTDTQQRTIAGGESKAVATACLAPWTTTTTHLFRH